VSQWPDFTPERLLRALTDGGVDFVVLGGLAVIAHGHVRATREVDITYDPSPENLDALGRVLVSLGARLRGVEEDVPFTPDGATLRRTQNLTLTSDAGWVDLLANPPGAPPYRSLRERATTIDLDGIAIRIASIDDLIAMKQTAGRLQDLADVEALEAIRRLRHSGAGA
jgi:predicted nucleotidyltransferase